MRKDKFAKRLEELRKARGLSQNQLAIKLGKQANVINKYERNENEPGLAIIMLLCDFFGCTSDYLIGRED